MKNAVLVKSIAEVDLQKLLRTMRPEIQIAGEFAFVTISSAESSFHGAASISTWCEHALMSFREQEGLTLVLPASLADSAGLSFDGTMRCITLTVHSSLQAVGLTAAVSRVLAEAGIPANVVAAYYHDHIFVPTVYAARAISLLEQCSAVAAAGGGGEEEDCR